LGSTKAAASGLVCTASSDGGSPSLHGYNYSEGLKHLDILWTPETLAKLFEIGPAPYTPGTKMPEQRIGSREDRDALVKFLERATR
jgi:cytochrome c